MARDQFQRVQPGDRLPGLPSQPWNAMLDTLKGAGIGVRGPADGRESAVEVLVANTTANPVGRFGILQVNAPFATHAQDADQFFERDALRGVAPAADTPFVVMQEPVSAGAVGWARILGLTRVRVLVSDPSHTFAAPGASSEYLESAAAGPAQIIWVDPACAGGSGSAAGSGSAGPVCWAAVLIGAGTGGGGGDRVEIVRPNSSGVTPPDPKLYDGQVDYLSLVTLDFDPGELCWYRDANNPA